MSNKTKNLQDLQCCNEISSNWLCYQVYQLLYNSYVVYQCAIRYRTMRGHFVTLKLEYFYRQVFIGLFCRKATILFNGSIRQWSLYFGFSEENQASNVSKWTVHRSFDCKPDIGALDNINIPGKVSHEELLGNVLKQRKKEKTEAENTWSGSRNTACRVFFSTFLSTSLA